MQTILLWFYLINGLYMFRTFACPSSGVLIYRLFHCRMWCYALFKNTNVKVAFRSSHTIAQLIRPHNTTTHSPTPHDTSGVYSLTCNTCKLAYVGQTSRTLHLRYQKHTRYIRLCFWKGHNTTCGSETTYIHKNSWRWTCKCPKHVEAIYEIKS